MSGLSKTHGFVIPIGPNVNSWVSNNVLCDCVKWRRKVFKSLSLKEIERSLKWPSQVDKDIGNGNWERY